MDGLPFDLKDHSFMHHLCMAGWYTDIDALLVPSSYEACGLPVMEAAASGRLVVCAKIGYFDGQSGALVRLPEAEWVEDARAALLFNQDPEIYRESCENAQQYARENFDWSSRIEPWAKLIE
jgi:glycosyltransferase involved in cell wall biosynthesis